MWHVGLGASVAPWDASACGTVHVRQLDVDAPQSAQMYIISISTVSSWRIRFSFPSCVSYVLGRYGAVSLTMHAWTYVYVQSQSLSCFF